MWNFWISEQLEVASTPACISISKLPHDKPINERANGLNCHLVLSKVEIQEITATA